MKSVVMCLFCGKLLRYKSIILSVDERIMALNICVADLRWQCFVDFSCSDAVFVIFFAVLRCSEPPHTPLFMELVYLSFNIPLRIPPGEEQEVMSIENQPSKTKCVAQLPDSYTAVRPVILPKSEADLCSSSSRFIYKNLPRSINGYNI